MIHLFSIHVNLLQRQYDINGRFQMSEGNNGIFPKEMKANRFFWDSNWLEIQVKPLIPLWDRGQNWSQELTSSHHLISPKKNKKWFLSSRKYVRVVHPGSRIRMLTFFPFRIPDPGVKKAPDPGSLPTTTPHPLNTSSHNTAARRPPHPSYIQQHTTTHNNTTQQHSGT